jgi:hypothetical protein
MSSTGNLAGAHGAQIVAGNNRSPWKLVVVTALTIVLIACALGRATFSRAPARGPRWQPSRVPSAVSNHGFNDWRLRA